MPPGSRRGKPRQRWRATGAAPGTGSVSAPAAPSAPSWPIRARRAAFSARKRSSSARSAAERLEFSVMAGTVLVSTSRLCAVTGSLADLPGCRRLQSVSQLRQVQT